MRFANDIATIRRGLQARLGDHYSQRAVAARVGVSPNTLSRWEKYALMPSAMAAVTLARDLGVTVEQLGFRRVESPKGSG
jgi:transcriptional regulator with XRE-family HTH domain